ncbi:hybrid sensor histidine kinase/response regulator [Nodosilinea sp. LEGE 07088]|uniref:ATP-binding response regulator n=1 Tax=Nodosilinea sp. LEGE 07088 TaxID=2777968 RepID=UPI00188086C5|nr:hybrid sensor histidine kinase/response regulator [Nodosilinea sp. LEGE 07088]MBE9141253.1 hybrid sensor histidine kinase/response regulator [Nodosilinea sp. LEGE 07088]
MPSDLTPETCAILAVDDSPDNLFLIESVLDDPKYAITCVDNGQAALDIVRQTPPDLILLDVMMPGLDGYAVTQKIRSHPGLPYIPILLITAHDQSSLVQGLDAGADDFIHKPVDVNELRARVRSLLRLKRSMDAQIAMLRQRDDFVARLTHDLRTPLVAANRMLRLCQEEAFGAVAGDVKQALANIADSNLHLLSMVNTLLEVYRHEAGHKALTLSVIDLLQLTEAVVMELAPIAAEKNLTCLLRDPDRPETKRSQIALAGRHGPTDKAANSADGYGALPETAFIVAGDRLELRRVITNLVGNAIKFTDRGNVTVTVGIASQLPPDVEATIPVDQPQGWVWVAVADTGIGIAESEQAAIFEWFRQGNQARAGHGLGLHLSQRIARLHHGTIVLQSAVGQGSCFTLYLPQFKAADSAGPMGEPD